MYERGNEVGVKGWDLHAVKIDNSRGLGPQSFIVLAGENQLDRKVTQTMAHRPSLEFVGYFDFFSMNLSSNSGVEKGEKSIGGPRWMNFRTFLITGRLH